MRAKFYVSYPQLGQLTLMRIRLILATGLILAASVYLFNTHPGLLTLDNLKLQQEQLRLYCRTHLLRSIALYLGAYIGVAVFCLPGAALMTLAAGALFGFGLGSLLASFSGAVGATCVYFLVRYLFHDAVQSRFSSYLQVINTNIERDGILYLLSLRLTSIFPYFIINALMALTPIRPLPFYLATQIGMLPVTLILVNAGTELQRISSPAELLSPSLLLSLITLGLIPLLTKKAYVRFVRRS